MVYYGGGKIKGHLILIFLITLFVGIMSVSATDTSNSTLSLDEQSVHSMDNTLIKSTTNTQSDNSKNVMSDQANVKEKSVKYNDNVNIESEKIESNQINLTQKTTNTLTSNTKTQTTKTPKTSTKENVKIDLSPVTVKNNKTIKINATFKTESGKPLNQVKSVLKINNQTHAYATITNGVAQYTVNVGNWQAKDYNILVKVGETSTTLESEKTSTLTVVKRNYDITLPNYTTKVNSTIKITATIKDEDGNLVHNSPVSFKINGKQLADARVVNGVVSCSFKPSLSYAGVNTILIKVGDNSYYNFGSISSKLTVTTTSHISSDDLVFVKKGNQVTLIATIRDAKGTLLKDGKVAFKVNGKTVDTVKVVNGVAKVTYNNSKALSHEINNITIKYSGNGYTSESNKTTYLRVLSSTNKYTYDQVLTKANDTKNFIEKNGRLPNFVTIGNDQLSPTDFFYLLCQVYAQNSSFSMGNFKQLVQSSTNCNNEKIYKEDYIALSKVCVASYAKNGRPQYNLTINGKSMNFADAFYFYTRAVAYIKNHGMCSLYGTVIALTNSSSGSSTSTTGNGSIFNTPPAGYDSYLQKTNYAQVNSSIIKTATKAAISGVKGVYNQAVAIFNYVRDRTSYSGYYNTRYGAEGTYTRGYGNCCDMANLIVAMMRTAGIPARYNHATCTFSSGLVTGHVWAQVYVNGQWYRCDATSKRNSFGVIRNWYKCGTIKTYTQLPF